MRAPAFWYKPTRGINAALLTPLSALYWLGSVLRRTYARPSSTKIPVICIGNIIAGGAGKTPTAIALAQALRQTGAKPVFVTRGYGGRLSGPLQVNLTKHTAQDVGDEALLLARIAPVWVGRNRAAAIKAAEQEGTHIILDDGLQNPHIKPDYAFLVIDATLGLGNEYIIPAGPLRESLSSAMKRVTAVILIGENDTQNLRLRINRPVLRAQWHANLPHDFPRTEQFFAFAGIGRPEKFYETCHKAGLTLIGTQNFADHHAFSSDELADLQQRATTHNARLLTTEKDWVRLPLEARRTILALPASLVFEKPESLLEQIQTPQIG